MVKRKLDKTLEKYKILEKTYIELRRKNYSLNESINFMSRCKILSPNKQQLKPGVSLRRVRECLREAKKEVRMY